MPLFYHKNCIQSSCTLVYNHTALYSPRRSEKNARFHLDAMLPSADSIQRYALMPYRLRRICAMRKKGKRDETKDECTRTACACGLF